MSISSRPEQRAEPVRSIPMSLVAVSLSSSRRPNGGVRKWKGCLEGRAGTQGRAEGHVSEQALTTESNDESTWWSNFEVWI